MAADFLPNDETFGWDGRFDAKDLNPGVFAYRLIVQIKNGQQRLIHGDITLIR
jgi:hypothetical protein